MLLRPSDKTTRGADGCVAEAREMNSKHNIVAKPRRDANDEGMAKKLWEVSEKIVAGLPA